MSKTLLRVWLERQERAVEATPEQHCEAMADEVIHLLRKRFVLP